MHAVVLLAVLKLTLKLELGPEYDSNANRSEVIANQTNSDPPIASALVRTTARGGLAWKRGANLLRANVGFGAKVFFNPDALDQSVIVVQGGLDDRVTLSRHAALSLSGDYYDAFQDLVVYCEDCLRRRDFRMGTTGAKLSLFDGPGAFYLGLGYRGFVFKPQEAFNFDAVTGDAGASVAWQLGTDDNPHEVSLSATYHFERRSFAGERDYEASLPECAPQLPLADGCLATAVGDTRLDYWHETGVELSYVGVVLASLGYGAQLQRSNSFGQSLLRHVVTLRLGYRFPWQLYATVKAQLLVSGGLDKVLLDTRISELTFATIEDENRNAVIVDVERNIPQLGLAVNARYSFFANELGSQQTSFRRHVAYLGLTYRFSTR